MTDTPTYPNCIFLPPEAFVDFSEYLNIYGKEHVCDGEAGIKYLSATAQDELIKAVVAGMPDLVEIACHPHTKELLWWQQIARTALTRNGCGL